MCTTHAAASPSVLWPGPALVCDPPRCRCNCFPSGGCPEILLSERRLPCRCALGLDRRPALPRHFLSFRSAVAYFMKPTLKRLRTEDVWKLRLCEVTGLNRLLASRSQPTIVPPPACCVPVPRGHAVIHAAQAQDGGRHQGLHRRVRGHHHQGRLGVLG